MRRLWAPWRLEWIKESSQGVKDCFLCDMLNDSPENERENLLLYRGEAAFLVMNRYPYTNGHLMVAPKRHLRDMMQLDAKEWAEIGLLTQVGLEALKNTISPQGFNLGWNLGRLSGAGLEDHLHQHIVPRWDGDTNFMPVVGQTRVISQDLWECYDLVKKEIDSLRIPSEPGGA
ncbi:MAG TPA: HIT domain-containing protein [Bacteroidetes bacterium]|nr:HIT domain-containing protein [Bacteroidota bacterium]HEX04515.1 HIT domain-containing protein [Bacteroidota bacterium]